MLHVLGPGSEVAGVVVELEEAMLAARTEL
jgi:hypothetical protein